jgi:hypothetical protein
MVASSKSRNTPNRPAILLKLFSSHAWRGIPKICIQISLLSVTNFGCHGIIFEKH